MTQVNSTNNVTNIMNDLDLGPTDSLQFMFAKLQLAQAQIAKDGAMQNIEKIQNSQAESAECAEMIKRAMELQNEAKAKGEDACTEMPADMVAYFKKHDITPEQTTAGDGPADNWHNKDEWDYNIQQLTALRDQLGTDTQQLMVFVQDFMGQYNSYIQGANSAIQQGNQTLQTLATVR